MIPQKNGLSGLKSCVREITIVLSTRQSWASLHCLLCWAFHSHFCLTQVQWRSRCSRKLYCECKRWGSVSREEKEATTQVRQVFKQHWLCESNLVQKLNDLLGYDINVQDDGQADYSTSMTITISLLRLTNNDIGYLLVETLQDW
jgi:hypothetical protein